MVYLVMPLRLIVLPDRPPAVNNENQHEQTAAYRSRQRWSAGKKMDSVLRLLRHPLT